MSISTPTIIDKLFRHKIISKAKRLAEYERGKLIGSELNETRNVINAIYTLQEETIMNNFDCLRGINEVLNKDIAKKAYAYIRK